MSSRGIFAVFPNLRGGLPSKEKKKSKKGKEGRLARTMMNVTKFGIEGGKVSLPSLPRPPFFHSFFHPVITTMNQPLIPITTPFPISTKFPPFQFLNSNNKITIYNNNNKILIPLESIVLIDHPCFHLRPGWKKSWNW